MTLLVVTTKYYSRCPHEADLAPYKPVTELFLVFCSAVEPEKSSVQNKCDVIRTESMDPDMGIYYISVQKATIDQNTC